MRVPCPAPAAGADEFLQPGRDKGGGHDSSPFAEWSATMGEPSSPARRPSAGAGRAGEGHASRLNLTGRCSNVLQPLQFRRYVALDCESVCVTMVKLPSPARRLSTGMGLGPVREMLRALSGAV